MKEIWKLIELLNEYSELKEERLTGEEWQPIRKRHDYELEYPIEKIRIISKHYWFIKWLVENDKIDLDKIPYLTDELWWGFDEYEEVIMILSISDEPIRFLCEIIK